MHTATAHPDIVIFNPDSDRGDVLPYTQDSRQV